MKDKIGILNSSKKWTKHKKKIILRALRTVFQVFHLCFGRVDNSKNCFGDLLTFRNLRLKMNLPRIDMAIPITMSKAPMVTALHACHKQVDVTWPSALNVENKGLAEGPLSPCPITVNQNWKFHPEIIRGKLKLFLTR